MEIINGSRFVLDAHMGTDAQGKRFLVAQAKATYRIPPPGQQYPRLADPQLPLLNADVFEGEPGESGLIFEADHAWFKPRCDVLVHASAHAPGEQAVKQLDVGFRVGSCLRTARVIGNRLWRRGLLGLVPSDPEPFTSVPISYGRAFGGTRMHEGLPQPYAANPIGCGFGGAPGDTSLVDTPVPNIEEPGTPIDNPRERYRPLSFGPIGRSWAGRVEHGGTYDQRWIDETFPLLPEDFDPRFFQAAPVEQQIDYPTGGEEVAFIHLHRSRPQLRFVLPQLKLSMVVLDQQRKVHKLEPVVDTLSFDLDAELFTVVWRARHPLKRSLAEVDALAAGSLCKRWWQARVLGTNDCGCGGKETKDEDQAPVAEIVVA
jgi:hypothetical protein